MLIPLSRLLTSTLIVFLATETWSIASAAAKAGRPTQANRPASNTHFFHMIDLRSMDRPIGRGTMARACDLRTPPATRVALQQVSTARREMVARNFGNR